MDYMNQGWGNPWQRQGSGSAYYGATSNGTSRSPWSLFDAGTTDVLRSGYMTGFNGGLFDPMAGYNQQMQQYQDYLQQNSMPNGVVNFQEGYYGMPDMTPNDGINNTGVLNTSGSTWTSNNPDTPYTGFDMNAWQQQIGDIKATDSASANYVNSMYQGAGLDTTRDGDFNVFTNMLNDGSTQQQVQDRFNNWNTTGSWATPTTTAPTYATPTSGGGINDVFAMSTGYQPDAAAQQWLSSMQTAGMSPTQIISAITKAQQGY